MTTNRLWYRQPATEWTDALPIGNGRLGAMVYGVVGREELQLNESTLWSGGPYQPTNPEALPNLPKVRELLFAGRHAEAQALIQDHLLAKPIYQMSYQPAGNLFVDFQHEAMPGSYRRELDLAAGVTTTRYKLLGTGISDDAAVITRESFVSSADDVLVLRLSTTRPRGLAFEVWLDSPQTGDLVQDEADRLVYRGRNFAKHGVAGQLRFAMTVDLRLEGGSVERHGRRLVVRDADAATLVVDIATSFRRFDDVSGDPEALLEQRRKHVAAKSFDELKAAHIREHAALFDRFGLLLGASRDDLPTDERIARFAEGSDPGLAALYVQYGRYLMISSSRPGTQPATLQGIWNKETRPPWGSKYTANINLQMNYWLPDPANLPEMVEPLIDMAADLAVTGAEMARAHYGARGWVMHHNTDIWRATGPVDGARWGMWPMGGAWLMAQLWDHVRFMGRARQLVERIYEPLRGATQFILDVLIPLPGSNFLVTSPSLSPENAHHPEVTACVGPAMDSQIIRDLFTAFEEASSLLGGDRALREEATAARQRLPEDRIGRAGQLQEWMEDWDLDVPEPHHRHVSHLYALYPSHQIDVDRTPDLAAAAAKSLELRGDEATGWGIGWRINLWARLRQGERALAVLKLLLSPARSYHNLFDAHPPFQIDGNFGGAAGIIEMLVQTTEDEIHILPALPNAWPEGSARGVRGRGGVEIDLIWANGRAEQVSIRSGSSRAVNVRVNGASVVVSLEQGVTTKVPVALL